MSDMSISRIIWKHTSTWLVIVGLQIGSTVLLGYAWKRGLISSDTLLRGVMVVIGFTLAVVGDRLPKLPNGPPGTVKSAALRQSAYRMMGWSLTLGGLAFAGLWAFAPLDIAQTAATIAFGGAIAALCFFVARLMYAHHRSPTR